ncbi:MAG: SDR family oxidoreductase [Candidatus Bathyarchaeota archaeon]|nr:SDR family oxidoreductase [Candidatus Bathyarchaeota archaeon]
MEKILVTGAAGFLGSNIVWFAQKKYEVIATTLNPIEVKGYEIEKLDVINKKACFDAIRKNKPDLVVHCGAIVSAAVCEKRPEFAEKVNVLSTRYLADACAEVGARIIFVSSDWVFDGKKTFGKRYKEEEEPNPVNNYGLTKLKAEEELKKSKAKWISARPANIYGNNFAIPKSKAQREDHLKRRGGWTLNTINALKEGKQIVLPINWFQTPTLASNFANIILKLHQKDQQGIFHISERTCISRLGFAKEVAKMFDLDENLIKDGPIDDFVKTMGIDLKKHSMQFPLQTCLDSGKVEKTLSIMMPSLSRGLEIMKKQRETYDIFKD